MRARLIYLLLIPVTILAGLATRKFGSSLPDFVGLHFGDALWACMIYFGFRFLIPGKSKLLGFLLALSFSYFIEFSQLYQEPWINSLRATTVGALILGRGFLWIDLVRYLSGLIVGLFIDYKFLKISR